MLFNKSLCCMLLGKEVGAVTSGIWCLMSLMLYAVSDFSRGCDMLYAGVKLWQRETVCDGA